MPVLPDFQEDFQNQSRKVWRRAWVLKPTRESRIRPDICRKWKDFHQSLGRLQRSGVIVDSIFVCNQCHFNDQSYTTQWQISRQKLFLGSICTRIVEKRYIFRKIMFWNSFPGATKCHYLLQYDTPIDRHSYMLYLIDVNSSLSRCIRKFTLWFSCFCKTFFLSIGSTRYTPYGIF